MPDSRSNRRASDGPGPVLLHVDPTCPFAWIAAQWLAEVSARTGLCVEWRLMSLSAVNEGAELTGWDRAYNDRAVGPARVAATAALGTSGGTPLIHLENTALLARRRSSSPPLRSDTRPC